MDEPLGRGGQKMWKSEQGTVANPYPIQKLQEDQSFKLRLAMEMAEKMTGEAMPPTYNSRPFCMSYRLKGVCSYNYGGRNTHRFLSS